MAENNAQQGLCDGKRVSKQSTCIMSKELHMLTKEYQKESSVCLSISRYLPKPRTMLKSSQFLHNLFILKFQTN